MRYIPPALFALLGLASSPLQSDVRLFDGAPPDVTTRVTLTGDTVVFGHRIDGILQLAAQQLSPKAVDPPAILFQAPAGLVVLSPGFAPDGVLYFESNVRSPAVPGRDDSDVWMIERSPTGWGEPRPLGPPFATEYNEHYPTADRQGTICVNSARPGGLGRNDIYCGRRDDRESPRLIAAVSSPDQDAAPWLSAAGDTLWLASNRPGGLGGWDIYVSRKGPDGWSAPQNVGAPINSSDDETWVTVTGASDRLLFHRIRPGAPRGRVYVTGVRQ